MTRSIAKGLFSKVDSFCCEFPTSNPAPARGLSLAHRPLDLTTPRTLI